MRVQFQSFPANAKAGQPVSLQVRVYDEHGRPVRGAVAELSASGGSFQGGGTVSQGTTDAKGLMLRSWQCNPCARGYELLLSVRKAGHPQHLASLVVRVE